MASTTLKREHFDSARARSPLDNRLLGALPDVAFARLRPDLEAINRPALEQKSCECYRVVKAETDRLLPQRDVLLTVE
jgi:hypothetical protein